MSIHEETVLASIHKAGDLETRIRVINVDGNRVVELRDFIPSLNEYGRGYWVPSDTGTLNAIAQSLLRAAMGS